MGLGVAGEGFSDGEGVVLGTWGTPSGNPRAYWRPGKSYTPPGRLCPDLRTTNRNASRKPQIEQKEIRSVSLRRTSWPWQKARTMGTGTSSVPVGAGISSRAPRWSDGSDRVSRAQYWSKSDAAMVSVRGRAAPLAMLSDARREAAPFVAEERKRAAPARAGAFGTG